jgi:gas vesicle protein
MRDNNAGSYLVGGIVVGLLAGVALGLLLSPKEGRETREMIREALSTGMERVRRRGRGDSDEED